MYAGPPYRALSAAKSSVVPERARLFFWKHCFSRDDHAVAEKDAAVS
jgi:hypothetical protein